MAALFVCSLFLLLAGCHTAPQWTSTSPQNGFSIFACVGDTITIPWSYILGTGDSVNDITWLYDGHSQEMIAIVSHGIFVPTPPFSHRVQQVGNAGISLNNAQIGDSGNYSVEIQVFQDSNSHALLRRTVFVRIHDRLMTTDGALHASQSSQAVLDPSTGQMAIPLTCGMFTFSHNPPFNVEWITPSGQVVNSTDFQDQEFRLLLQSPVQGGNFTCRIPPHSAGEACLHGNAGHQGEATVYVDKFEARLSILEKENQILKDQLQQSNAEHSNQLSQVNASLNHVNSTLSDQVNNVNSAMADQQGRLHKLEDAAQKRVAFHATTVYPNQPPSGTPLIFTSVIYNEGNGYSSATGQFTAPFLGVYYFIATTGDAVSNDQAWHYLIVDGTQVGAGYSYKSGSDENFVPVHAVLHLQAGQKVWIKGDGSSYEAGDFSMFSGFLLSHDP